MPINGQWRRASADHVRLNVPNAPGVYELRSFGRLVYLGYAENLRAALLHHLGSRSATGYRYERPGLLSSAERLYAAHRDAYERRHGRLPPWNATEAGKRQERADAMV